MYAILFALKLAAIIIRLMLLFEHKFVAGIQSSVVAIMHFFYTSSTQLINILLFVESLWHVCWLLVWSDEVIDNVCIKRFRFVGK